VIDLGDATEVGGRLSYYIWHSLDPAFIGRAAAFGNLPTAFDNGKARIGRASAYVKLKQSEQWPVVLWGQAGQNFDASKGLFVGGISPVTTGKDDMSWMTGIEVGDKKQLVKLGLLYGHVEANAVVAQFTDSDWGDGFTNREGWAFYGSRQIAENFDFVLTLFRSDVIDRTGAFDGCGLAVTGCGPYAASVVGSKRWRLQTDLQVKFD
jgi:hypothetical protein